MNEATEANEDLHYIPQTFSDFVPGAKAHPTAANMDEDKENHTNVLITLEDAAADAQVIRALGKWPVNVVSNLASHRYR